MDLYLQAAIEEAHKGVEEGGIPIGSVLVLDGKIVGRGHNRQAQSQRPSAHAEMECIDAAGFLSSDQYRRSTLYTTLSPCYMCAGAIVFFKIPKVVIAENTNLLGAEDFLRSMGVEVVIVNDPTCIKMLHEFDIQYPGRWMKGE
ncbi:MAG TPA: nucleoside deaminase [Anaerolineales bacterium]|nr:nucleoside deaminase [Anaerolineales bacterium]